MGVTPSSQDLRCIIHTALYMRGCTYRAVHRVCALTTIGREPELFQAAEIQGNTLYVRSMALSHRTWRLHSRGKEGVLYRVSITRPIEDRLLCKYLFCVRLTDLPASSYRSHSQIRVPESLETNFVVFAGRGGQVMSAEWLSSYFGGSLIIACREFTPLDPKNNQPSPSLFSQVVERRGSIPYLVDLGIIYSSNLQSGYRRCA